LHYFGDIEEELEAIRRETVSPYSRLNARDLDVLQEIQRENGGSFKRHIAAALVELGIKVDAHAALRAANEAA
jgi:hypothetical protein